VPIALINVVGLSAGLLPRMPRLSARASAGAVRRLVPPLPAVTCTAQASMLTGLSPRDHGIVGNGWFDRALGEVHFWKQSNRLVGGEPIWDALRRRDPSATVANLFWWFNMFTTADFAVTPRPMYPADGRKIPDVWTQPADLRDELQKALGQFPLFKFWGPMADIESSTWIVESAKLVVKRHRPTLTLVYVPHLDYSLQKFGPDHEHIGAELRAVDTLVDDLCDWLEAEGVTPMIVSEYGIGAVDGAVCPNRILRDAGLLAVRNELGREILDPAASGAFAVVDHQVAHVYARSDRDRDAAIDVLGRAPGVADCLHGATLAEARLDHPRSGDAVLVAEPRSWFAYPWWHDDARAPDYARTVDIHRKPGYDPCELFLDPKLPAAKMRIGWTLFKRKLGQRALLEVIPLDPSLVRGSHGLVSTDGDLAPVLIAPSTVAEGDGPLPMTTIREILLHQSS